jgi:hypothetical protein
MSAAGRRRISLAQKARWAKQKANGHAPKPKRTISLARRKRIAVGAESKVGEAEGDPTRSKRSRWSRSRRRRSKVGEGEERRVNGRVTAGPSDGKRRAISTCFLLTLPLHLRDDLPQFRRGTCSTSDFIVA